jgi:hypothetical protein
MKSRVNNRRLVEQMEEEFARMVFWPFPGADTGKLGGIQHWAHRLDVSTQTAREAAHRLIAHGLVRTENGVGLFAEPAHILTTPDSLALKLRSAQSTAQRTEAFEDWLSLVRFVALEALSLCASMSADRKEPVLSSLCSLRFMTGTVNDGFLIAEEYDLLVWWAARLAGRPFDMFGNALIRAFPSVRDTIADAVDRNLRPHALQTPWGHVADALTNGDAAQTRATADKAIAILHDAIIRHVKDG